MIQTESGIFEFKFTRKGWDRVEIDRYGNDILNRSYHYYNIDTLNLQIENWRDLPGPSIDIPMWRDFLGKY